MSSATGPARPMRSTALMPVLVYAISGAGFALANLLLARWLPEGEYAVFTLVLALMNLGSPLAAIGLDAVAVRRRLDFGPRLLRQVLLASSAVGVGTGLVGAGYGLGIVAVGLVVAASAGGGTMMVAAAEFQRRHRFGLALSLLQAPNLALLVAAGATLVLKAEGAMMPLVITAVGSVLGAGVGWALLLGEPRRPVPEAIPWREALSLAGTNASGTLLGQLDRLIIPYLLPLSALATYGALSAVIGSLFRVLQRGVGYALLPRLRAAGSVQERRRLVGGEARLVTGVAALGAVALWLTTPAVEHWVLGDKYHFAPALVLAAILAGAGRIFTAFSRATVTALADARELALVNLAGWAAVALAVVAAAIGARWGLAGVIYGVGLGWVVRALASLAITMRHLRPAGPSSTEP
ncbi:MAG TPA: hypothetical protein VMN37_10625 [Gemmatimonadales bacterium]|nr:hypothetical protein [Gemmatimonadales bacterium]